MTVKTATTNKKQAARRPFATRHPFATRRPFATRGPSAARILLPAACLSILSAAAMLLGKQNAFITDTDYFWHIELGKNILETGRITGQNTLSWIAEEQGLPFINHSWASDILLYLLSKASGVMAGACIYSAATMLLLGICLYALWAECLPLDGTGFHPTASDWVLLGLVCWAVYRTRGNPRPQQISLIFFVAAYRLLKLTWQNKAGRARWLLPVLAVIWANFHGGTLPILFALTGLYGVLGLLPPFSAGKISHQKSGDAKQLAVLLAAEAAAGCINPYGPVLYTQLYRVSVNCASLHVTEWQPASMGNAPWVIVSFAVFAVALVVLPQTFTLEAVLPVCMFAGMTMLHFRAYAWYAVVLAVFLLEHRDVMRNTFPRLAGERPNCRRIPRLKRVRAEAVLMLAGVCGAGVCAVVSGKIIRQGYYRIFSDELTTVIQTAAPERMFTSYNSGGMAIHAGFPSFVDSRADAFTPEILLDSSIISGNATAANEDKVNDVLDTYKFDALLLARYDNRMMIAYFAQREDWTCIYSDTWYALFVPTTGAAKFAAEYMNLNGKTDENGLPYTTVYLDMSLPVEYVAPGDVAALIHGNGEAVVFFADARDNSSRTAAAEVQTWAKQNGYEKLYVCNIKPYRMEYGYDDAGELVVTQNRSVGYDELLAELEGILPYYRVEGDGENRKTVTLDVKTVEPPLVVWMDGGKVGALDLAH